MHGGPNKGQQVGTNKRPLRHLARFILIEVYSGTRVGAIASASPTATIGRSFVEFNGEGISSVKTAFKHAVTLAKLGPGVSPHTLRHTAASG